MKKDLGGCGQLQISCECSQCLGWLTSFWQHLGRRKFANERGKIKRRSPDEGATTLSSGLGTSGYISPMGASPLLAGGLRRWSLADAFYGLCSPAVARLVHGDLGIKAEAMSWRCHVPKAQGCVPPPAPDHGDRASHKKRDKHRELHADICSVWLTLGCSSAMVMPMSARSRCFFHRRVCLLLFLM